MQIHLVNAISYIKTLVIYKNDKLIMGGVFSKFFSLETKTPLWKWLKWRSCIFYCQDLKTYVWRWIALL